MSSKSTLLISSFLVILCTQSAVVRADYSSPFIDDDIEAAESMKVMRPLLDFEHEKMPLTEFEPNSPMKNYTLVTEEALDKQEIPGFKGSPFLSTDLEVDIANYQFGLKIRFAPLEAGVAPDIRKSLKDESWMEILTKAMEKLGPYPYYLQLD